MAFRIEQGTVKSAEICNRQKNHVNVLLQFANGTSLRASLRGNPYRDLAGRTLKLVHPCPVTDGAPPENLASVQAGVTGDITAARKVKVATIPRARFAEYRAAKKEIPETWKNSLYLEWYSRVNGRVVLEADEFECSVSEPAWEMSAEEEESAREAASESLAGFLDELCVIDRSKKSETLDDDGPMDEFEWEKFLRHSDDLSKRYSELIEKFGIDDEDSIARYMKWSHLAGEGSEGDDESWREGMEEDLDGLDAEKSPRRWHPLQGQASELLDSVEFSATEPNSPLAGLWSAVATVSAKLAGALPAYENDLEPDAGFTIAQLKRCLVYIDDAVGQAQKSSPSHVQPLLLMRQSVIDLQNELRNAS